ncbi:MAG: glycogen/starch/alpha-glucan phosphorylase [Oscillospiraceae bacterium]|nr:glycogen/starch/alpha-glucan phosphorylase [Oscillospiraceae bacterium]MCL2164590.1 glycogen/starch/alpha-glucan phosphorylase [Oscillospiraceae bacterium]
MFSNKLTFQNEFKKRIKALFGITIAEASNIEKYAAIASMVRETKAESWVDTNNLYLEEKAKQVYYFSLEFLVGKFLEQNLIYINALDVCKQGLEALDIDFEELCSVEPEAGLGNGGLGRLAACFLDSLASLGMPGHGCGIRYKYGLFNQKIINGYQVELPDNWLREANAWEIRKFEKAVIVNFGGYVRWIEDESGNKKIVHENCESVLAVPYDTPILGYRNDTVNTLRLWSAETLNDGFNFSSFSQGDYINAVSYKYSVEAISEVLYPDDSNYSNKILRLKQQYFFVSAGLMSIIRRFKKKMKSISILPEYITIHINDTHPALAVPEMMRILMDENGLSWDEAWGITTNTIAYTNHTIMPEALEKWPTDVFKRLLPRIYMIVEEINERFCKQLWQIYPGDWDRISDMAIIGDGNVRMAHLAVVGSYSVNGVAAVHTELLKSQVLKNFHELYPEKINNKTNGITHRRWLLKSNPGASELISDTLKEDWIHNPEILSKLAIFKDKRAVQDNAARIKRQNKEHFAKFVKNQSDITIDPDSVFDVQIKRIHAYKRQLLNLLHILYLYNEILDDPGIDMVPRTFIIGGKAAPSYYYAKNIIKLVTSLADMINSDPSVKDRIKLIFLENYNVSSAELIFPASDVSEQISTASKEASGTGNMKFMMNGAITVGTMDGANIEIKEAVGEDNFVTFGLSVEEVLNYYANGNYFPFDIYNSREKIHRIIDELTNGFFHNVPKDEFLTIRKSLLDYGDEFFVLKDFDGYVEAQKKIDALYRSKKTWLSMSIVNIAQSGRFSSDNTIKQYASEIWDISPIL